MNNQEEKKMTEAEKQMEILVPEEKKKRVIKDLSGNEYEIPDHLPLSKQIPINRAISRMIRSIPGLNAIMEAGPGEETEEKKRDNMEMLASFADAFFSEDSLIIISNLINKPVKWVSDNISEEEMIGAITPFFFRRIGSMTRLLAGGLGLAPRSVTG